MDVTSYDARKAICKKSLGPFLEMLEEQRFSMGLETWLAQLSNTETRVTQNPEQYLGRDLPELEMTIKIVKEIFHEFKEEQFHLT